MGTLKLIGCKPQLFNFWGSYKVVDSESFNFCFLGLWASEEKNPSRKGTGSSLQSPFLVEALKEPQP